MPMIKYFFRCMQKFLLSFTLLFIIGCSSTNNFLDFYNDEELDESEYQKIQPNEDVLVIETSNLEKKLDEYYNDTTTWTDDMKAYMLTQDVCIGKRKAEDQSRDGVVECSRVVEGQVFALLRTDEFLSASLDATCENTLDKSWNKSSLVYSLFKMPNST